jgi:hypothetical protein
LAARYLEQPGDPHGCALILWVDPRSVAEHGYGGLSQTQCEDRSLLALEMIEGWFSDATAGATDDVGNVSQCAGETGKK